MRPRSLALIVVISTIALAATWGIVSHIADRQSRALLEEAKQEMNDRAIRTGQESIDRARRSAAGLGRSPLPPGRLRASA